MLTSPYFFASDDQAKKSTSLLLYLNFLLNTWSISSSLQSTSFTLSPTCCVPSSVDKQRSVWPLSRLPLSPLSHLSDIYTMWCGRHPLPTYEGRQQLPHCHRATEASSRTSSTWTPLPPPHTNTQTCTHYCRGRPQFAASDVETISFYSHLQEPGKVHPHFDWQIPPGEREKKATNMHITQQFLLHHSQETALTYF